MNNKICGHCYQHYGGSTGEQDAHGKEDIKRLWWQWREHKWADNSHLEHKTGQTLTLNVLTHSKGLSGDGPDRGEMTVMVIRDIPVLVVTRQKEKIAEWLWLKSVATVRCQDFFMDYESDF